MNYLARLKRLSVDAKTLPSPQTKLTEPPKAPFVSYGSATQGLYEKNIATNDEGIDRNIVLKNMTYALLTKVPEMPFVSSVSPVWGGNQNNQAANDQPAITSFGWLFHFIDRDPLTVTFSPEVTHADALACYPDAVAAEPIIDSVKSFAQHSPTPKRATAGEAAQLAVLISDVYRDDTHDDRNEALQAAMADPANALACFTAIALERDLTPADTDDRRTCRQCASLTRNGICSIARPGGPVSANLGYRPAHDLLQRCAGFSAR